MNNDTNTKDTLSTPANNALALGNEIKQIVAGSTLEKDAMLLAAMYQSGYFKDLTSLSKTITKALIGEQMGMGLVQSMNSLFVVDGKVHMDSHAIRNQAVRSGYSIKTVELNQERCVLEWSFDSKVLGLSEFTWEDASAAGLINKDNWRKYPKDMLFARAMTRGARMYANQAFANQPVYEREEILEYDDLVDIAPDDERVDKIRNAKDLKALTVIVESFTAEEQAALAHEVNAKIKELSEGKKDGKPGSN